MERVVYLAGFQPNRFATGVRDDLFVRTLALQAVGRPFVLSVVDVIGLARSETLAIRERAERAGVDADIVVASTHTHSGPDTIGLWGPNDRTSGVDEEWLEVLRSAVVLSIRQALERLQPAWLRFGQALVEGVVRNVRDPEILDPQVCAMAVDRADGGAIATVMNLGCHPEVLDGESTMISADMAGAACRALEHHRGGVGIWTSGDLGGMQSPDTDVRTPEEAERLGGRVAAAAIPSLETGPASPAMGFRAAEVRLPLWNPRFRTSIESGLLRRELEEGNLWSEVAVLELERARFAFMPGEVLPKLGLAMKERLACEFPFLVGLANDELGYVLPEEDFVEPEDWDDPDPHYEESMSVGPETGPRLLFALERLLASL